MSRQSIQDYLGVPAHWPVVEKVKHEIVLMPNKQDIKGAKRQDPQACALHNAACRLYGIPNCAIGGNWAYIPQRRTHGQYYIAKVKPTAETRVAIRRFDVTGEIPEGGFRFRPLSPSEFRKHVNKQRREAYRMKVLHGEPTRPERKSKSFKRKTLRAIPKNVEVF